jgi:Zn-dependent protease/predicted transcriptional regulator
MNGALRVLSVGGIPIHVHASWLAIYALITWTLAVGYFPQVLPDMPTAAYWVSGLIAALLLFVSVLLHELSHSFVARAHGLSVRGITLHVFGGVSHLEDEPPTPRAEFLIAAVGPLTSFGIAAVLWLARSLGIADTGTAGAITTYLLFVNVAVGVFNLIPGFPLDGGRILRAALWRWNGTLSRATYIASRVGVFFAWALVALGLLQILSGAVVGGIWLTLIGLFLQSTANAGYAQMALREALGRVPVRDVMARDVVSVPADASVEQLVDQFWVHHFTSFPVVEAGRPVGIASVQQVHAVPRDRWPLTRVREVMHPLTEQLVVSPSASVFDALAKAAGNRVGRLAVMDDTRLVGYLSLKDITHVLALRGLDGGTRVVPASAPRPLRRAA